MTFPKRIYTIDEVQKAKNLIDKGYTHRLKTEGSSAFKQKVKKALELLKTAGYYTFLRTYIRSIVEIDGLTQLRETEATIWANKYAVENSVDAASLFVQKANHMEEYLKGELYYGGSAEKRSVKRRIEFLEALQKRSRNEKVIKECDRLLKFWKESSLVY